MRFRTTLELGGRTATGVEVPAEVVTGLGSHRRPAVTVTINGYRGSSLSWGSCGVSKFHVHLHRNLV